MSLSSETRKAGPFAANGSVVNFSFSFKVFTKSDLSVTYLDAAQVQHGLVLDSDYTVALNADQEASPGGSITTVLTYAAGTYITITSGLAYTQSLKLTNPGGFYPEAINDAFDRVTILAQQLKERLDRAIVGPVDASVYTDFSHLVFGVNGNGLPVLKVLTDLNPSGVSAFMLTLLDDASASVARTTLGIPSVEQSQTYTGFTSAGSQPNFTVTSSPAYGAYASGQVMRVKFHAAGTTGSNTLNRDGLGAKNLKQYDSSGAKIPAVVALNQLAIVEYDGTDMVIVNPLTPASSTIKVATRQTVSMGPIDSNGLPSFLPATDADLNFVSQNITGSAPLIVAASNGYDSTGKVDRVGQTTSNLTWTGLTANTTNYLYVTVASDGTLTPGFTTLKPVYQHGGAYSTVNGQATFNIQEMVMKLGNGSVANQAYLVFVGEAVTNGTGVTSSIAYAYNGRYDSGYTATLPGIAVSVSKPHNIGCKNHLGARFVIECTTTNAGYAVGDIIDIGLGGTNASYWHSNQISFNELSVNIVTANSGAFVVPNKSTGAVVALTLANWKYKFIVKREWG